MQQFLYQALMVALMIFGFGFVVFFHELGHFLAAKWVGIRVEQFAVGFGQALFAWRKGIGWRVGSTYKAYQARCAEWLSKQEKGEAPSEWSDEQINQAGDALGLGETEYRLNWIPLGGYVKMLGQDDLKPNATASDPRAYNRKGVGQRMIVVSAGVIMNLILAAIGFVVVFLMGFNAPPPVVGRVAPNSPALRAGVQVGDKIVSIDGTPQYDFNRIVLTTALLREEREVPVVVERRLPGGGTELKTFTMRPSKIDADDPKSFLAIGIGPSTELRGPTGAAAVEEEKEAGRELPDYHVLGPGESIVAINGQAVDPKFDYYKLERALNASNGQPVPVTVKKADGSTRQLAITPHLDNQVFGMQPLTIAGMMPRPTIDIVPADGAAAGVIKPGDVVTAVEPVGRDLDRYPDAELFRKLVNQSGSEGRKINITVLRDGKAETLKDVDASRRIGNGKRGLGVAIGVDESAVVSRVAEGSPAKKAGIPSGAKIDAVDGKPVSNWFEVKSALASAGSHKISASVTNPSGEASNADYTVEMTQADVDQLNNGVRAVAYAQMEELKVPRKAKGVGEAINWGVVETRDFILQFYVTLTRMFQGRVSYTNMMGPVGIVTAGAKFAFKGMDWLIWFLAMISANLAVVNFLPIPIVDGGLFTFLIVEKVQGKPISPRTQAVAQVIGFAVIISVFLLVTFQDIKRTIGM